MAQEPFLINPPKRKKIKGKRHRPVLYGSGKSWKRSPLSRSLMSGIKLNPFRRHRKNPFGETLMIAGGNPVKRHRKRSKKRSHRRSHRGFMHNPVSLALGGPMEFKKNAGYIFTAGGAAILAAAVPSMVGPKIGLSPTSDLPRIGMEAATGILGGMAINAMGQKNHAAVFTLVVLGVAAADVIKTYVLKPMGFLSGYEISDYSISDVGAYGADDGSMGAFPNTMQPQLGAFPSTIYQY